MFFVVTYELSVGTISLHRHAMFHSWKALQWKSGVCWYICTSGRLSPIVDIPCLVLRTEYFIHAPRCSLHIDVIQSQAKPCFSSRLVILSSMWILIFVTCRSFTSILHSLRSLWKYEIIPWYFGYVLLIYKHLMMIIWHGSKPTYAHTYSHKCPLSHLGLVTSYGRTDLGLHWLR